MDARIHSSIHFDFPFNLEPHPWHLHHHPEASPHIFSERSTAHLGPTEHFDFNGGAEEATDHAIDSDNRITAETAAIEASLVETLPKGPAHDVSEFYIHNLRKRKVGRPRKHPLPILGSDGLPLKKIRGRPRLHPLPALGENGQPIKKKRGRPPKVKPLPDQTLEVLGNAELGEDMSFDADDEATSGLLHHSDSSNHLNTAGQRINPALVMDPAQRRLQEGSAPIESPDSIMSNPIALAESVAKDLSEVLGISRPLSVDDKINLHTEAEGFDPDHSRNMSNQVTLHHIESENDSPKRMRGRAKERSLITDPLGHLSPDFHSSNEAMVNSASELLGHHPVRPLAFFGCVVTLKPLNLAVWLIRPSASTSIGILSSELRALSGSTKKSRFRVTHRVSQSRSSRR